jgi:hypothetical protein
MITIPTELITLFTSSFLGGVMKGWSRRLENQRLERLLSIRLLKGRSSAPERPIALYEGHGVHWTRRSIAMMATFFIIAFPKLVAIFFPQVPIHIGYMEFKEGFLGIFGGMETFRWMALKGVVITPLDTHILSAIMGLYFGGSLMGSR